MSQYENNISGKLLALSDIKANIKRAIGTESDDFSTYPTLIEEAISAGGSATPADPWYEFKDIYGMVSDGLSSADYYSSVISNKFNITTDGNDAIEAVEWNEVAEFDDGNGNIEEKTVHVIVNGDPHGILADATGIDEGLNDFSDLYNSIYPMLENVTLTTSSDPTHDGYDYLIEGDLHSWNLNDNFNPVLTIENNGFYGTGNALGFNVNVSSGGLSEGTFSIFNFLAYGSNNGMVEINNKGFEEINLYNLGPVNYIDPMDGTETKNQYVVMNLWDNPQMDTEVQFVHVQGDATSNGSDHWYQFNELSQSSEADEFMVVHIDVYDWQSDIDPDTGMDAGSWEVLDTYVAEFENAYTDESDGNWTYTIRFYYNNNDWVVDLYHNGILAEEGVRAVAQ